jgi:hypothetical protein
MIKVKPGPVPLYDFTKIEVNEQIKLDPMKLSSFKSKVSKYNKDLAKDKKQRYSYEQTGKKVTATRIA